MNAVGIDVSKGKSTVTIRRPGNEVLLPPCDFPHTQSCINGLIEQIKSLDGETKVCMEHTGRYYEPVAYYNVFMVDIPNNQLGCYPSYCLSC